MEKNVIKWLPVLGYEQSYEVSNDGRIRSLINVDTLGRKRTPKELACTCNNQGYKTFRAFDNKGSKSMVRVHRCVAQSFIPNPEKKPYVNHKDGNKSNNHVSNLEWATASENQKHAYKIGLKWQPKGCNHSNSKITNFELQEIRSMIKDGYSQQSIADRFGLNQTTISGIKNKRTYRDI